MVEGDHSRIISSVNDLLKNELLSMESQAIRMAQDERTSAALEEVDENQAQLAVTSFKLDNHHGIALYDFDGDFFIESGLAPTPQLPQSVQALVKNALSGTQNSSLSMVDNRLALVSAVPVGDRTQPNGSLLLVRWLDDDLCQKIYKLLQKDISILHRGLVQTSTIPNDQRFEVERAVNSAKQRLKTQREVSFDSGALTGMISPLDLAQVPGKVHLATSQPSLIASIPWLQLFELFGGTIFVFGLLAFFSGKKTDGRHKSVLKEISATLKSIQDSHNLTGQIKFKQGSDPEVEEVANSINSMIESFDKTESQSKSYRVNLEKRIAKISDVLSIDNGAFRFFVDRVNKTQEICSEELRRFQAKEKHNFQDTVIALFRNVHTIKSNARLFNLKYVHNEAKSFEHVLEQLRQSNAQADEQTIKELNTNLQRLKAEVDSYCKLRLKLLGPDALEDTSKGDNAVQLQWLTSLAGRMFSHFKNPCPSQSGQDNLHQEFERSVSTVGKEDVMSYIKLYENMCKTFAARLGKKIKPIRFTGNVRYLSSETLRNINDILVNCLRNSISHGIERIESRKECGKEPAGELRIDLTVTGETLAIGIFDDGAGIDPDRLARKVVEKRLLKRDQVTRMSDEQLIDLIFQTGLTTAETISDVSGRGVGMDVVRDAAKNLGGNAKVISTSKRGTHIEICVAWEESRFINRHSIFDLGMTVQTIHSRFQSILLRNNINLVLQDGFSSRNLVLNDHSLIAGALQQIFLGLISSCANDAEVHVSLTLENEAFNIRLRSPSIDTSLWNSGRWMQNIRKSEIDCDFRVTTDDSSHSVNMNVPLHMGAIHCEKTLHILALTKNPGEVEGLVSQHLLTHMATWPYELYGREDIKQFNRSAQASSGLIFVEEGFISAEEFIASLPNRDQYNVVVLTQDASIISPKVLFSFHNDPLIVERKFDESAIAQALETSLLKIIDHEDDSRLQSAA
jgi:HPt (histidine-containing phosphotransfer) domain-containing protein